MADIIAKFRKTISSFGQLKIVPPLDMGGNQIKDLAAASIIATAESGKIRLTSKTNGAGSFILMGDSTLKTVLGLANAAVAYGTQGLGYETDMEDAEFVVMATLDGVAQASLTAKFLSITNKSVSGFVVECGDNTATDDVAVAIFGQAAAPA